MHSIGLALTDTLDDLISEERINPQLAMKILGNFDQAITEALQKNVKSRLSFKVNMRSPGGRRTPYLDANSNATLGEPGYVPVLRRGMDVSYQERHLQDGQRHSACRGR